MRHWTPWSYWIQNYQLLQQLRVQGSNKGLSRREAKSNRSGGRRLCGVPEDPQKKGGFDTPCLVEDSSSLWSSGR